MILANILCTALAIKPEDFIISVVITCEFDSFHSILMEKNPVLS